VMSVRCRDRPRAQTIIAQTRTVRGQFQA
jgi:hypothetical protein